MRLTEFALAAAAKEMCAPEVGYLPVSPEGLLRERVESAIAHVPFYRKLYEPFGAVPPGDEFPEWFATLPVVTKSQLQAAGRGELLNRCYSSADLVPKPTSGSTGVPFTLLLDNTVLNFRKWRFQRPYQQLVGQAPTKLVFVFPWDFVVRTPREPMRFATAAAGTGLDQRDHRDSAAAPAPEPPSFESMPKKTRRTARATRAEAVAAPPPPPVLDRPFTVNSWLPPDRLFTTLLELGPASLIGFASNLAALARWMRQHSERLPSLRQIWTTSEVLAPDGADAIRDAMGCEPLAIYASNEFGFMAWEAGPGEPMRFDPDRFHVEFLATRSSVPARVGDLSRIVVTDLLNDTMPLIRYDIADIARPGEPVRLTDDLQCATVTDLQGKETDLLLAPDGRTVTPFQVLGAIRDHLPDAQYRFIALDRTRYVLQYRPGAGFTADLQPAITAVGDILGPGTEIVAQQVSEIAREPSGKLRPVVNLHNLADARRRTLAAELGVDTMLPDVGRVGAVRVVARALAVVQDRPEHDPARNSRPDAVPDERLELYADLAIDSLKFVQLIAALERELDREIDDEDLLEVDLITIGDLVTFVDGLLRTT